LQRHRDGGHLSKRIAKSTEARENAESIDLVAEIKDTLEKVKKLQAACDEWLTDPATGLYDIGPRSDDVTVTYWHGKGKARQRKKERLSVLLARLDGLEVERSEWRHADPRELILKVSDRVDGHVRVLGELLGKLQAAGTGTVSLTVLAPVLIASFDVVPPEHRSAVKAAVAAELMRLDKTLDLPPA
jgi:hypothetical protein